MMLASDAVGSTWAMINAFEVFFAARIISSAFENEVSALAVRLRDKAHMPWLPSVFISSSLYSSTSGNFATNAVCNSRAFSNSFSASSGFLFDTRWIAHSFKLRESSRLKPGVSGCLATSLVSKARPSSQGFSDFVS